MVVSDDSGSPDYSDGCWAPIAAYVGDSCVPAYLGSCAVTGLE